jgi:lipopolysaccharide export system protein LptA
MMRKVAGIAGIALALLASAALGERADREKEIVLLADKGVADDNRKVSVFEGNVIITQGTMRVTASKVTLSEKENFKFYIAQGAPVTFRQKRDKVDEWIEGTAERAEFDDKTDVLKLFNRAKVKSAQNEITGEYITYDMRREVAEVTGAAPGQQVPAAEKSRVKVIIVPQKEGAKKDEGAKEPARLKADKELR